MPTITFGEDVYTPHHVLWTAAAKCKWCNANANANAMQISHTKRPPGCSLNFSCQTLHTSDQVRLSTVQMRACVRVCIDGIYAVSVTRALYHRNSYYGFGPANRLALTFGLWHALQQRLLCFLDEY